MRSACETLCEYSINSDSSSSKYRKKILSIYQSNLNTFGVKIRMKKSWSLSWFLDFVLLDLDPYFTRIRQDFSVADPVPSHSTKDFPTNRLGVQQIVSKILPDWEYESVEGEEDARDDGSVEAASLPIQEVSLHHRAEN